MNEIPGRTRGDWSPRLRSKLTFAAFSEFPRSSASFYFFIFGRTTWYVGSSSLSRD